MFAVPAKTVVITCRRPPQTPVQATPPAARPTTTSSSTTRRTRTRQAIPEMTGTDLKSSGTQADFDRDRPADRPALVHGQGQQGVPADHPASSTSAGACYKQPRSTSRSSSTATSSRSRRSTSPTVALGRHPGRRPDHGHRLVQRGEGPRARPPDRRPAGPVHAARADRRLGDARQGLAEPGEEGRAGRPADRRALPAPPLPLPRPRRRDRPRHLRRVPVRGDPAPQRDADAAGLRRHDPDDRRRRRRERRHLRTHQGRGARREVRARGDRRRLREGLPHDHRRERRHGDHGARPVRGRDRGGEGLRADAADRHRDLAGHGRRRDARDARAARGLPLVRQPGFMGANGQQRGRWLQIDFMRRRYLWFAISGA